VAFDLPHLVPPHVRDLEVRGARLGRVGESDDGAVEDRETRRRALGALLEEHLLADAQTQERFSARGLLDRIAQAAFVEAAHAVGHRALPGEDHAVGAANGLRIARDLDGRVGRDVGERFSTERRLPHP
jgi:hypothetical protein